MRARHNMYASLELSASPSISLSPLLPNMEGMHTCDSASGELGRIIFQVVGHCHAKSVYSLVLVHRSVTQASKAECMDGE